MKHTRKNIPFLAQCDKIHVELSEKGKSKLYSIASRVFTSQFDKKLYALEVQAVKNFETGCSDIVIVDDSNKTHRIVLTKTMFDIEFL